MTAPECSGGGRAECLGESAQGPAAVAHGILLLGRDLAEGPAKLVAEEERVVSEPSLAARGLEDESGTGAFEYPRHRAGLREVDEHAAIPRAAPRLGCAQQPAQQLRIVGRVHLGARAGDAGPATGADAGRAAEGEHLEARIVGNGGESGAPREVLGLPA